MQLHEICYTYLIEDAEIEKFEILIQSDKYGIADYSKEPDYLLYDRDAESHYLNLYDVYFKAVEDATKFNKMLDENF